MKSITWYLSSLLDILMMNNKVVKCSFKKIIIATNILKK